MSAAFVAMSVVQVLLGTAVPLLAAMLWHRRGARYASWGWGALVFVLSQVVHIPLNVGLDRALHGLAPSDPSTRAAMTAVVLGLSAGVCEEGARFVFFHFAGLGGAAGARGRDEGLMVGLGHGGIESMLFGTGLVLLTLSQLAAIDRAGVESLHLDVSAAAAVQAQLDALHAAPWWSPLVGAAERLMVQPFHVAATMLVLYGAVRSEVRWVLLAILAHALLDAGSVWWLGEVGPLGAELWVLASVPLSLVMILGIYRALPPQRDAPRDPRIDEAEPSGAPLELVLATKIYEGGRVALREATLVLEPGSRTCLLGPNGAGKTTTIRLALGALAPTRGKVWLFGAAHDSPSLTAAKARVGVVPQQPGMYEDLTVRAYLELVRDLHQKGAIDEIARDLSLEAMLDRPMARHSGGEQRRIALAAALLCSPELLVLDEPSAGLDPLAQRAMRKLLARVGEGRTVLLCTHDLEEAEALSDRVVILDRGEVKVHERIDILRARFVPKLRLRARQSPTEVAAALAKIGAGEAEIGERDVKLAVAGGRAIVPSLVRSLVEASIDLEECVLEEASLEDIFMTSVRADGEGKGDHVPA